MYEEGREGAENSGEGKIRRKSYQISEKISANLMAK
jgi:hypothetical protein